MPRLCSICASPARAQIDEALVCHAASYRAIARQHGLIHDALMRQERAHLHQSFRQNQEAQALMNTKRLVALIAQMDGAVDRVLARSETAGDDRLILQAVKEARANVETLSRIGVMGDWSGGHFAPTSYDVSPLRRMLCREGKASMA